MSKTIDYANIPIPPPEVDRKKFDFRERRAEELRIILTQGHCDLPTLKLGERYGVSPAQITKDKHVLQKYIAENYFEPKKLKSSAIAAKQRALKGALEAQDWKTVNQISDSLLEMGYSMGIIEKEPEKVQQVGAVKFTFEVENPKKGSKSEKKPE